MRSFPVSVCFWALLLLLVTGCGESVETQAMDSTQVCTIHRDCADGSHCTVDGVCFVPSECVSDDTCGYGAQCDDGMCRSLRVTDVFEDNSPRPVSALIVVDDGPGMCEFQVLAADRLAEVISQSSALDSQFAVISTSLHGPGAGRAEFRRGPGPGCEHIPGIADCPADGPTIIRLPDYDLPEEHDRLRDDLRCLMVVGDQGPGPSMGLEAMRQALLHTDQAARLLRDDTPFAVHFVSNRNDCSDGTTVDVMGPVYLDTMLSGSEDACQSARNLEDSCTYTRRNPGPMVEDGDETKSGYEWCAAGDPDAITRLSLSTQCPQGGCQNRLVPRAEYQQFLTGLMAEFHPENSPFLEPFWVRLSSATHLDDGSRSDPPASPEEACGPGVSGYRYALFGQMAQSGFDESICLPAWSFYEVSSNAVPNRCLQEMPRRCTTDGDCPIGTCDPYLEGTLFPYSTCSVDFAQVTTVNDGEFDLLPQPDDVVLTLDSTACIVSGSPVEWNLTRDLVGSSFYFDYFADTPCDPRTLVVGEGEGRSCEGTQ